MTFLVQTLPKHGVILTTASQPIIKGEVPRIFVALKDKLKRRGDRETIHMVMDISALTRQDPIPAQHYVAIFSRLYEEWHFKRTIVMWMAVNEEYLDAVTYMMQKQCLPIFLHTDVCHILDLIDERYASTGELRLPQEA